ncbi:mitochondrial 39-S ribosomal protein L47 (MRP-L47)-domain-containing protein, partial [Pseudomassariella vexata]
MASPASIRPSIGRILQQSSKGCPSSCYSLPILMSRPVQSSPFSTTPELQERRPKRDNNRLRGLSSLYRSGFKASMAIDGVEIPKPAKYKPEIKVDPNHGLWDFFYEKDKLLQTPEEDSQHGRAWTVEELRHKSWDDLHKLWYVCVKERNRIATATRERKRIALRTGDDESEERDRQVLRTMKAIKFALTERYYSWEDARKLAEEDPEVNLSNTKNPYTPLSYLED